MGEDAVDHDRVGDGRNDLQLVATPRADQGIYRVDALDQPRPATPPGRDPHRLLGFVPARAPRQNLSALARRRRFLAAGAVEPPRAIRIRHGFLPSLARSLDRRPRAWTGGLRQQ